MKEYKNGILSSEHSVTTRDVFHTYLRLGIQNPDNMTLNAFMVCFKVLFKLYDNFNADYELTIGEKECHYNAFSADHCNNFVQQQKEYHKKTMDEVVSFIQICHATEKPLHEQR